MENDCILIVDDEERMRKLIKDFLKQKNYNISLYDLIKKMIKKDYINDIDKITYDITKNLSNYIEIISINPFSYKYYKLNQ